MKNTILRIACAVLLGANIGCGEVNRAPYSATQYTPAQQAAGIAVAIVYDNSGSMGDGARDANGNNDSKYRIANRALLNVVAQLKAFVAANPDKPVEACLITFTKSLHIDLGKFDPAPFEQFANTFTSPNENTPLGNAIESAGATLLQSPLAHRHIITLTDGGNNSGPSPENVFPRLSKRGINLHVVAFDIDDNVFNGIKQEGATVVNAADEKQLGSQLTTILKKKVLLEDAE